MSKYEKYAEICEALREMSAKLGLSIVTAQQPARDGNFNPRPFQSKHPEYDFVIIDHTSLLTEPE